MGGSFARTGIPAALSGATYDAANRIVTWAGTSFSYDLNGNQTGDGTNTFSWDARNQLTALTGATSATFAYDATKRRRSKTIAGITTNFLYDDINIVQEQASGGSPTANLVTGLNVDEFFQRNESSGSLDPLVDALGTTLALADGSGAVQTSYTYEPFGATTVTGASSANSAQFTAREHDLGGLYFLRARYYDATKQRLVSEDPLDFAGGGANLFEYAGTNPLSNSDPVGLTWQTNWEFLKEWLSGAGARNRNYGPGDIELFEMQVSVAMAKIRQRYAQGGCQASATIPYGSFGAAWDTILNPWTNDFGSTALQVGGFSIDIQRNADGTVTYILKNIAGTKSFFYHLVPNSPFERGLMRTITQNFTWTESSPCMRGRK